MYSLLIEVNDMAARFDAPQYARATKAELLCSVAVGLLGAVYEKLPASQDGRPWYEAGEVLWQVFDHMEYTIRFRCLSVEVLRAVAEAALRGGVCMIVEKQFAL